MTASQLYLFPLTFEPILIAKEPHHFITIKFHCEFHAFFVPYLLQLTFCDYLRGMLPYVEPLREVTTLCSTINLRKCSLFFLFHIFLTASQVTNHCFSSVPELWHLYVTSWQFIYLQERELKPCEWDLSIYYEGSLIERLTD